MKPSLSDQEIMGHYVKVAEVVGETFSPFLEVVVHDFQNPKETLRAIVNGHVTGRKIGDPPSSLGVRRMEGHVADKLVNYVNTSPKGNPLKSSSLAIRNSEGKMLGSFCLNFDLEYLNSARQVLDLLAATTPLKKDEEIEEVFSIEASHSIQKTVRHLAIQKGTSLQRMKASQRQELIRDLVKARVFEKRGAVPTVAKLLGVTPPSIYAYLKKI